MDRQKIIEAAVSDAIIGRPISFELNKEKYEIHPPTLGKMQILSKLYLQLEIDEKALAKEPHLEAMRVCESKTDIVCQLMAVATLKSKDELFNEGLLKERAELFKWNCYPQDFGTCLLAILAQVDYENFMTSIRLTKTLRLNKPTAKKRAVRVE
nr:hypothetical protein [uncultured Alistipes sp.]